MNDERPIMRWLFNFAFAIRAKRFDDLHDQPSGSLALEESSTLQPGFTKAGPDRKGRVRADPSIGQSSAEAETMSARFEQVELHRNPSLSQGEDEQQTVLRRHRFILVGMNEERRWCLRSHPALV